MKVRDIINRVKDIDLAKLKIKSSLCQKMTENI